MPRGGPRGQKKSHKGRGRHFTDAETLKQAKDKEEREKEWRAKRGEGEDDEGEEGAEGATGGKQEDSSSSEEDSSDDDRHKDKGVSHLIEIENPNRMLKKSKKVENIDSTGPTLTRKEKEEVDKQQSRERYQKLHQEGKTEEARTDLARLALIRKQREDAAKKRDDEKKEKENKEREKLAAKKKS